MARPKLFELVECIKRNIFGWEWFLKLNCLKNCTSGLRNVAAGHDR